MPTMQPSTNAPTQTPGERTQKEFTNIALEFSRADKLNQAEIDKFETLTKEWFEGFFLARSGRRNLQTSVGLRDMQTNITVTGQKFLEANAANGRLHNVNTITYSQTIDYIALERAPTPEEFIVIPFLNNGANIQYRDSLARNIDALRSIESVPIPEIVQDDPGDDGGLGAGAIVGIALGAVVVGVVVGFFAIKRRSARRPLQLHKEDRDSSILRPVAPHDFSQDPTNATDDMPPDAENRPPLVDKDGTDDNARPMAPSDSSPELTNTTDDMPPDAESQLSDSLGPQSFETPPDVDGPESDAIGRQPVVTRELSVSHKDQGRSVPLAEARLLNEH